MTIKNSGGSFIKPNNVAGKSNSRRDSKVLGRGPGSGLGKTSGRGGKGQTARSGVAMHGFEGGQSPLHARLPKRGFDNRNKIQFDLINISDLQKFIISNELKDDNIITIDVLKKADLYKGKNRIKLLARIEGDVTFPINVEVHAASARAVELIEAAGGKVIIKRYS